MLSQMLAPKLSLGPRVGARHRGGTTGSTRVTPELPGQSQQLQTAGAVAAGAGCVTVSPLSHHAESPRFEGCVGRGRYHPTFLALGQHRHGVDAGLMAGKGVETRVLLRLRGITAAAPDFDRPVARARDDVDSVGHHAQHSVGVPGQCLEADVPGHAGGANEVTRQSSLTPYTNTNTNTNTLTQQSVLLARVWKRTVWAGPGWRRGATA